MAEAAVTGDMLDPLALCLEEGSAQRIADFRIVDSVQARAAEFASRANEGLLSGEERAEYEALVNAADFRLILKLKARRRLSPGIPSQ